MITFLVSANDTGVGKTWVCGLLAARLGSGSIQMIKPVETGVAADDSGDLGLVATRLGHPARLSTHRLCCFPRALAPMDAAVAEGMELHTDVLVDRIQALPAADWRIVEGAGGIAVPLDEQGHDWADFAAMIGADRCLLVVEDRLGAINQARLVSARAVAAKLNYGLWLNQCADVPVDVLRSNHRNLLALGLPLVAKSAYMSTRADILRADFFQT